VVFGIFGNQDFKKGVLFHSCALGAYQEMSTTLLDATDRRRSIPLSEVALLTGLGLRLLQTLAQRGLFPGAFKPTMGNYKSKDWRVMREPLEAWWAQQKEAPQPTRRRRRKLEEIP
jgi:hypothetical protein